MAFRRLSYDPKRVAEHCGARMRPSRMQYMLYISNQQIVLLHALTGFMDRSLKVCKQLVFHKFSIHTFMYLGFFSLWTHGFLFYSLNFNPSLIESTLQNCRYASQKLSVGCLYSVQHGSRVYQTH